MAIIGKRTGIASFLGMNISWNFGHGFFGEMYIFQKFQHGIKDLEYFLIGQLICSLIEIFQDSNS